MFDLSYYIKFGGITFFRFFLLIFPTYILGRLVYGVLCYLLLGRKEQAKKIKITLKSALIVGLLLIVFTAITGGVLSLVYKNIRDENIIKAAGMWMSWDKKIFGVYPSFWFSSLANSWKGFFDGLAPLIIAVYGNLTTVLGIVFLAAIGKNVKIFYKMFFAFVLCVLISAFFWHAFPAITPLEMYVDNGLKTPISSDIKKAINDNSPNQDLQILFSKVRKLRQGYSSSFKDITTMPSMHVAWSLVALFFAFQIWRPSLIFMLPYFILNSIATVYVFQHYGVDVIGGILVGLTATILVNYLVDKFYKTTGKTISSVIQGDLAFCFGKLRMLVAKN